MSCNITSRWVLIFALSASPAFADAVGSCGDQASNFNGTCYDAASNYSMTMKGFRLREVDDNGDPIGFVDVSSTERVYNFASVDASSTIANYIEGAEIPAGTYDAVSPILSSIITVAGSTMLAGDSDYTCATSEDLSFDISDEGGTPDGSDEVEGLATYQYGDDCSEGCGDNYINSDGDFVIIDSSVNGFPVTIEDGDSLSFTMTIDIAETMHFTWDGSQNCTDQAAGELYVDLSGVIN